MASGNSSSKFKKKGDGISPREDCWYSDHSQQWQNNSPPEIFQLEKTDQSNCTYPKTGLEDSSKMQWGNYKRLKLYGLQRHRRVYTDEWRRKNLTLSALSSTTKE